MSAEFASLESASRVLRDGLALLDESVASRESGGSPDLAERLAGLTKALGDLPDPVALRATVPADELERFDDELEELSRLNAVLLAAVAHDRDSVGERLVRVHRSRRDLQPHRVDGPGGVRCDATG